MVFEGVISIIGAVIEIVSILLFFVVVYYVFNVRTILRGINGWNYIAAGFLFIIFRRFLGLLLAKQIWLSTGIDKAIIGLSESVILLLITALFIIGFYKLNKSLDRIEDGILRDGKRRKKRK
jgi:hypothetical protein